MQLIKELGELSTNDVDIAGGKGASLGEMTGAGIKVPPGFVILSDAFEKFISVNSLDKKISEELAGVKGSDIKRMESASATIQKMILSADFPSELAVGVDKHFKKLDSEYVAVRSSATAEDGAATAWAGQLDSFLNTTSDTLLENIRKCWASLFTERAIFYRIENALQNQKISVAVVVQKMVNSELSGIAFSVHPVTQNKNEIIIESSYGLGEAIVSGQVSPDSFVVSKRPRRIVSTGIGTKERGLFRGENGNVWMDTSLEKRSAQSLSDKQVVALAAQIIKIEKHYGFACDIEWAYENNQFYIVQSRPITTLSAGSKAVSSDSIVSNLKSANLQNDWEGPFSILATDLAAGGYFSYMEKRFGTSLPFIYVAYKNGFASCYLPVEEYERVGKKLAVLASDIKKLDGWISEFKDATDRLLLAIDVPARDFLDNLKELRKLYSEYTAYQVATKTAFNFLPTDIDSVIPIKLEEGRRYSEDLFKRSEKKIHEVLDLLEAGLPEYSSEQLGCLAVDDLAGYLKNGSLPTGAELQDRHDKKGLYWNKGKLSFLTSVEVDLIDAFWLSQHSGNYITGVSAYPGMVQGVCRLIRSYKGADINEGEVLVTGMTDPHFVPLMKKAGAIITDGGGLLCHAAIVARELKKPCVIGTKIATKIISTGDQVEVNANEGVVKIIKE